ncbi:MAG: serine hydrolase domain-containing protein, partial [Thermoanaerobaculia bacterium]
MTFHDLGKGRSARPFLFALFFAACASSTSRVVETFDGTKLRAIDARIEKAIADHQIPGGVFWMERNGVSYHRAYGDRALVPTVEKNSEETIYDAASITKVVATAPSIWLLIQQGRVALDETVKQYIPEFTGDWRDEITVRHLLTHASGLRPD